MALLKHLNANATTKRPQFFRVLIPNPFVKLNIPQNFMKHIEGDRHNKATLLSPCGKFWHINLHQEGDILYLDGGWSSFANAHDLRTGYFVVFRYEGNMVFTVKVFDETCCLKEYELASCKSPGCSRTSNDSSEVECLTLSQSSESEDEVQGTHSSKKRKSVKIFRERTTSPLTSFKTFQKTSLSSVTPPIKRTKKTSHGSTTPQIKKFQKTSPSSSPVQQFEKTVRPFSTNYMSFPKKFCMQNGLTKEIILKNTKGKSYAAYLYDRPTEVRVGKGWKNFSSENGIRDGDTCVFKLVAKSTMLVTLKNAQHEAHEDSIQYSQFEKIIRPFNLKLGIFTIPRLFCLKNGLDSKRIVILEDSVGKKWQVRFLIRDDKAKFQKGWSKFSKAYDLEVGDKCTFIFADENTFRVIVEKKQAESDA